MKWRIVSDLGCTAARQRISDGMCQAKSTRNRADADRRSTSCGQSLRGAAYDSSPWPHLMRISLISPAFSSLFRSVAAVSATATATVAAAALGLLLCQGGDAKAQVPETLPFFIGEHLTYEVRVARVKRVGEATMWVEGPVTIRGTSTILLRFDFEAGFGPIKAMDRTSSWLDPLHMATYRFSKRERHSLSKHNEDVELFPAEHRWEMTGGATGVSPSDAPLDELSFMYFLRTLPLTPDTTFTFDRHFDPERNPTTVRVVRREVITTTAGMFSTVLLEMRVRDPRHYHGEGVIRINISDDTLRLPVRIESCMPVVGTATLTLHSYTQHPPSAVARSD